MNGAARTGHGDKFLAGATDEFALGIARWLAECVEACPASKACWTGRAWRAGWTDAAACTVRATWTRRTWRTGYAGGTRRALSLRSGRTRRTGWSGRPLCPLRTLKAAGQREADDQCNNHDGQAHRRLSISMVTPCILSPIGIVPRRPSAQTECSGRGSKPDHRR